MTNEPSLNTATYHPRLRWLAALASLYIQGLGQLYAGKPRRAVAWFALYLLQVAALASTYIAPFSRGLMVALPLFILIWIACGIDAWRQAAQQQNYVLRPYNRWWVYLVVIVAISVALYPLGGMAMFYRTSHSYVVPAASMTPNIIVGDYLMADEYPPRLQEIKRGDVILFKHDNAIFVKRVIGLPGDQIAMTDNVISINGQALSQQPEPDLASAAITQAELKTFALYRETWPDGQQVLILKTTPGNPYSSFPAITVPDGTFFAIGDSRDNSNDSRAFGPVPQDQIVGRASFIWWSRYVGRIGRIVN